MGVWDRFFSSARKCELCGKFSNCTSTATVFEMVICGSCDKKLIREEKWFRVISIWKINTMQEKKPFRKISFYRKGCENVVIKD